MRLIAEAAGVKRARRRGAVDDSDDDSFGADDADWDVYKQMDPNNTDSGMEPPVGSGMETSGVVNSSRLV